jgi:hypothetical protein
LRSLVADAPASAKDPSMEHILFVLSGVAMFVAVLNLIDSPMDNWRRHH